MRKHIFNEAARLDNKINDYKEYRSTVEQMEYINIHGPDSEGEAVSIYAEDDPALKQAVLTALDDVIKKCKNQFKRL